MLVAGRWIPSSTRTPQLLIARRHSRISILCHQGTEADILYKVYILCILYIQLPAYSSFSVLAHVCCRSCGTSSEAGVPMSQMISWSDRFINEVNIILSLCQVGHFSRPHVRMLELLCTM